MKRPLDSLGIHKFVIPRLLQEAEYDEDMDLWLHYARATASEPPGPIPTTVEEFVAPGSGAFYFPATGAIFDCRKLPLRFIIDTGEAAMPESFELHRPWKLPYENCYFEFSGGLGILAISWSDWDVDSYTDGIEFRLFNSSNPNDDINRLVYGRLENDSYNKASEEVKKSGTPQPWQLVYVNNENYGTDRKPNYNNGVVDNPEDKANIYMSACLLTGVLTLLNEHLVAMEIKPDPAPALTKARAKKGLYPLSSATHVLTINTAAVRRVSSTTKLKSHESPRLHWRRGHWRVLHRFSEFEKRVWVQRCLVGDPERGFIDKDYRLTWNPSMLIH